VIAFRRGSAAEVIDDGVSGYLVEDVPQAIAAVRRIPELDRARVRETFERRFDIGRVAREYVQVYRTLASAEEAHRREPRRNGLVRNHVPHPQRSDQPILVQLGTEVANVTPAE
jgi:alkanesulfonate monooxygenase SsuD/methylene tetrahydromethanopterin reductase-like flavin-dependent oxidoreductase (luciferase family)